jgi:hypothetical protein
MYEDEGPSGPWPRSSALLVVLIVAFVFGALSFVPLVGAVLFYPKNFLAPAPDYITRSAVGDGLQVLFQLLLVGVGYLVGKKVMFERDYAWVLIPAYFGAVLGYLIGIPGLETTTVAGGIYVFQTNPLDPTHLESAFFNSPTLMGMLISGLGLAFIVQRRASAMNMPDAGELTSTNRLLVIFAVAAVFAFLAYMMPPIFYIVFRALVGAASASTGAVYAVESNSNIIANPILFFVLLYLVSRGVRIFRDYTTIIIMLFIAVIVGAIAGNPIGSYATGLVTTGTGAFPNYLASANLLTTFIASVIAVSMAGTFLGFAAISESTTEAMSKAGTVPPPSPEEVVPPDEAPAEGEAPAPSPPPE